MSSHSESYQLYNHNEEFSIFRSLLQEKINLFHNEKKRHLNKIHKLTSFCRKYIHLRFDREDIDLVLSRKN